jgi:hypothetical protein
MFSVRFIRIVALALGLTWLPMSAFAQMCATHSIAMKTGGPSHPALPQTASEAKAAFGDAALGEIAVAVVIDAETFWHSVDSYDDGCQAKSMCAFAGAAAMPLSSAVMTIDATSILFSPTLSFPGSRERAPETPPPRFLS